MTWQFDSDRDRMMGHDHPGACGPGMHDFTLLEAELGARAAMALDEGREEQAFWNLDTLRWELGEHPEDLGTCPYYAYFRGQGPPAICGRGCWEEPRCVTEEPLDGWPSANRAAEREWGQQEQAAIAATEGEG